MWDSAFLCSRQFVTHALLCKPVLPSGGQAFEKVSAAIAVRTALGARASDKTLLFLVPEATASTALHIGAALLVGNHAHANGGAALPADEARQLFKGDLLVITPFVSKTKGELDNLPLLSYEHLRDLWDVVPLSRYSASRTNKPRVFLANPGWAVSMTAARRFGAVVIDGTHPRTFSRLPDLLRAAVGCSSIRIAVAPPLSAQVLSACGYPGKCTVWLWDPQAKADAERVVENDRPEPQRVGSRTLWVCHGDAEGTKALESLYRRLVSILKQSEGRSYPGLFVPWSVYARLRNLAVPLTQLEEVASGSWMGTLRRRIESLASIHGYGNPVWDATWPDLCEAVRDTYATFLKRQETAKFWALAARLEQLLKEPSAAVRIVAGSEMEAELLRRLLVELIDSLDEDMAEGRVDVVTPSQEARLVAGGFACHTLLLGPRTSASRHLDLFPSEPVELFVYPFEAGIEQAAHQRLIALADELSGTAARIAFLAKLGLRPPASAKEAPSATLSPGLQVLDAESGRTVELAKAAETTSLLDISSLLSSRSEEDDLDIPLAAGCGVVPDLEAGDVAEVVFAQGATVRYPAGHNVDVFFTATGQVERRPARELQPGWHVISFVDGQYDNLFRRLTEAVEARLPAKERIALELWAAAKRRLNQLYPNKREFHERLRAQGLTVTYEAFCAWLREGDEGVLAPQQFEEFAALAKASGVYPSEQLVKQTFRSVQKARGRNRSAGRRLSAFLRAVVSGDGYDDALESARSLDAGLGDVLAAVEVLDVASVRLIPRKT